MSARAQRACARKRPAKSLRNSPNALNFGEIALRVSLDELLNLNARCAVSFADLPLRIFFLQKKLIKKSTKKRIIK
jgi:hypothetical protein